VQYEKREPGQTPDGGTIDQPWFEAHYDFVLQPQG
jgi:hydroxyquinol 1,2-dioxygenase